MNTLDVLRRTKEILADPSHWLKQHNATDEFGIPVPPQSPEAINFCLMGAVAHAMPHMTTEFPPEIVAALANVIHHHRESDLDDILVVVCFNDNPLVSHENVIDLLDRAILSLEKQEARQETRPLTGSLS